MKITIRQLTLDNFADYESLTACQSDGGCYCAFWHVKVTSMDEWKQRQKDRPDQNRAAVFEKVRSGFHVGALAYQGEQLVAWLSVGPLSEFHWTWKRVAQVGESANTVAGITCFTIAKAFRGAGLQSRILEALKAYGRERGWKAIEGYPFDASAVEKHKEHVLWPGLTKGFEQAGYHRIGAHWLSNPEAERSIFRFELGGQV
ncbi:MAG: hypothetical protein NDJ89_13360 [Oligoflexia bacterium]|nr:hypothetical protein [Oligoflexia bacterium]